MRMRMIWIAMTVAILAEPSCAQNSFETELKALFSNRCAGCHTGPRPPGGIHLESVTTREEFLKSPETVQRVLKVIRNGDMPPDADDRLTDRERGLYTQVLTEELAAAVAQQPDAKPRLWRLNRFQYNYAVRDLLQLKRNLFALPEKMMTRHSRYLNRNDRTSVPDVVDVSCDSLAPVAGLKGVNAFPRDLRAAHGFDNQSNQLSLSPLLLDAFLKLSVSIVESPDFTAENVGVWNELFADPPAGNDPVMEAEKRLRPFLRRAFRGRIDDEIARRYVDFVRARTAAGATFTDCMKKVVSAALSSPLFLLQSDGTSDVEQQLALASRLSFFLWSSGPDDQLLKLAEQRKLHGDTLRSEAVRMTADPRIERFLDTFPTQWMQLENILAATPDPAKNRYFSLEKTRPAGLQMVLEPLLLFDTAFVENRPITELISPDFTYQSDLLNTWYNKELKPKQIDRKRVADRNQMLDAQRAELKAKIAAASKLIETLETPVRTRLLEARKTGDRKPVDLKPYEAWEFDGNLKSTYGRLDLQAKGKVQFADGMVVLDKSFLQSPGLPFELRAKTLEVWCRVPNIEQRGGGVMGVQGPGDFFDTIVLGERKPRHWISGSNGFSRTEDFPESKPEEQPNTMLHLVMVYQEDGNTRLYRNGTPYGKPYQKGKAVFPAKQSSIIFGLRHLPAGGNRYLAVSIDRARFYNRALTPEEVKASDDGLYVSHEEVLAGMTKDQRDQHSQQSELLATAEKQLAEVPANGDVNRMQADANRRYEDHIRSMLRARQFRRVSVGDSRYGGIITNAAMLSMTSGPKRTHPIARGAWVIEVVFNNPPPPPPNDVPPLNEDADDKNLTIREKFAAHRENPDCAGCHSRLDPLGFALENFDITGRWRDRYENGREVDAGGRLLRRYDFDSVDRFKASIRSEERRFATAFSAHLLRFAVARELKPEDDAVIQKIVEQTAEQKYRLQDLVTAVVMSSAFRD